MIFADSKCPKCRSSEVLIRWHEKAPQGRATTCERARSVLDRGAIERKEHLHYHCRRCQYDWTGPVASETEKYPKEYMD